MKPINNMVWTLLLGCIFLIFSAVDSHAQESPPNWWMTNSLKIDNPPPGTHFHAEADYTFYASRGNVDMTMHKGALKTYLRNGRFLFETLGSIDFQKIQVLSMPESRNHVYLLNPKLIYDLTSVFQSETGVIWEKDDGNFLDLRTVYYSGLIFNQMEHQRLGRMFFVAGGYQTIRSNKLPPELSALVSADVVENEKFIVYAMQTFVLKVTPKIQLIEKFTYIQGLDDTSSYRTDLELQAQFALTNNLSGLVAYQVKYQNERLIPELDPFIDKINTSFTVGVRVNI